LEINQDSRRRTYRSHVTFDKRLSVLEPGDIGRRISCCGTAQCQCTACRWCDDWWQLLTDPPQQTFNTTVNRYPETDAAAEPEVPTLGGGARGAIPQQERQQNE